MFFAIVGIFKNLGCISTVHKLMQLLICNDVYVGQHAIADIVSPGGVHGMRGLQLGAARHNRNAAFEHRSTYE